MKSADDYQKVMDFLKLQYADKKQRKDSLKAKLAACSTPVPDDLLHELEELFVTDAIEVLRSHPGFRIEEKIRSLRAVLQMFECTRRDVIRALEHFDAFSQTAEFNYPSHEDELHEMDNRIRKEVFAFSTLAHSLQDHCRRLRSDWEPINTTEQLAESFGADGLHDFICGLRSALHHRSMVEADWLIRGSGDEATSHYVFETAELVATGMDWNGRAETYLGRAGEQIDIEKLVEEYSRRVHRFYSWLLGRCDIDAPPSVLDYRRCWSAHRRRSTRVMWRAILSKFLEKHGDPYEHLHRFLTACELEEALRLPHRSSEQIEFIIRTVDRDGACDDELRSLAHQVFAEH